MDNPRSRTGLTHLWDNASDLEGVRAFVSVAELKSFRAAAEAMGVPRSTVSRRIAQLEERLGQRLLQRTTRVVAMTEAGEAYLGAVGPALNVITEAGRSIADAQAVPRGVLKLTAPPFLAERILSPVLTGFMTRYPDVRLEIDLTDRYVDLVAEGYDVAVRAGVLPDSSLVARPLGTGAMRCYAHRDYLEARGRPKLPADLAAHAAIVFSGDRSRAVWGFLVGKKKIEVKLRPRLVVNSIAVACDAALAGLGIARVPESVGTPLRVEGRLLEVLSAYVEAPRPLHIVYPSGRHLSPRVRSFVEYVMTNLRVPGR